MVGCLQIPKLTIHTEPSRDRELLQEMFVSPMALRPWIQAPHQQDHTVDPACSPWDCLYVPFHLSLVSKGSEQISASVASTGQLHVDSSPRIPGGGR